MLYGESAAAANNKLLAQFNIAGIPAAAAGVPQIEVTFSLSADLRLAVVARDLDTGRQQVWEQGRGAVIRLR